jgi:ribosome-associated toxin RatA of RatAB toxin-antitoxin module
VRTSISIEVAAPPETVFALAADLARWPDRLPHYREVTIESRDGERIVTRMRAVRPGIVPIAVAWRAEHWPEANDAADLQLHFRHVAGPTRGMKVVWHIRRTPAGAAVTIEHELRRPLPLVGPDLFPALVDRLFIRPIAGRTLATFKALAEQRAS